MSQTFPINEAAAESERRYRPLNVALWKMSVQAKQKLPNLSVIENTNLLYQVMFTILPRTEVEFI